MIDSFTGANFVFSNFFMRPVLGYKSVEHGYQAHKATNQQDHDDVANASTPAKAKKLGRVIAIRPDWEEVKIPVMDEFIRAKFEDPELRALLLATGDEELIEGNNWGDKFWGMVKVRGEWVGENHLGKILMKERARIRKLIARTRSIDFV